MAKKQESETLKQQRLARQEFLELKKMQSGEIETGPKPSEVAIVPKTLGEKVSNIWYHFGKIILIGLFIAVAISIMVVQCATKTKYDLKIVYFTYSVIPDSTTEKMAEYFKEYCEDVNGDGEVNVAVINCSCNPNTANDAKLTKMQSLIVAEPNALLYITDDKSISYFDKIKTNKKSFFKEQVALNDSFYEATNDDLVKLPENLVISIRNVEGTQIGADKDIDISLDASQKLLDKIK